MWITKLSRSVPTVCQNWQILWYSHTLMITADICDNASSERVHFSGFLTWKYRYGTPSGWPQNDVQQVVCWRDYYGWVILVGCLNLEVPAVEKFQTLFVHFVRTKLEDWRWIPDSQFWNNFWDASWHLRHWQTSMLLYENIPNCISSTGSVCMILLLDYLMWNLHAGVYGCVKWCTFCFTIHFTIIKCLIIFLLVYLPFVKEFATVKKNPRCDTNQSNNLYIHITHVVQKT